jgi:hypothetical protein
VTSPFDVLISTGSDLNLESSKSRTLTESFNVESGVAASLAVREHAARHKSSSPSSIVKRCFLVIFPSF